MKSKNNIVSKEIALQKIVDHEKEYNTKVQNVLKHEQDSIEKVKLEFENSNSEIEKKKLELEGIGRDVNKLEEEIKLLKGNIEVTDVSLENAKNFNEEKEKISKTLEKQKKNLLKEQNKLNKLNEEKALLQNEQLKLKEVDTKIIELEKGIELLNGNIKVTNEFHSNAKFFSQEREELSNKLKEQKNNLSLQKKELKNLKKEKERTVKNKSKLVEVEKKVEELGEKVKSLESEVNITNELYIKTPSFEQEQKELSNKLKEQKENLSSAEKNLKKLKENGKNIQKDIKEVEENSESNYTKSLQNIKKEKKEELRKLREDYNEVFAENINATSSVEKDKMLQGAYKTVNTAFGLIGNLKFDRSNEEKISILRIIKKSLSSVFSNFTDVVGSAYTVLKAKKLVENELSEEDLKDPKKVLGSAFVSKILNDETFWEVLALQGQKLESGILSNPNFINQVVGQVLSRFSKSSETSPIKLPEPLITAIAELMPTILNIENAKSLQEIAKNVISIATKGVTNEKILAVIDPGIDILAKGEVTEKLKNVLSEGNLVGLKGVVDKIADIKNKEDKPILPENISKFLKNLNEENYKAIAPVVASALDLVGAVAKNGGVKEIPGLILDIMSTPKGEEIKFDKIENVVEKIGNVVSNKDVLNKLKEVTSGITSNKNILSKVGEFIPQYSSLLNDETLTGASKKLIDGVVNNVPDLVTIFKDNVSGIDKLYSSQGQGVLIEKADLTPQELSGMIKGILGVIPKLKLGEMLSEISADNQNLINLATSFAPEGREELIKGALPLGIELAQILFQEKNLNPLLESVSKNIDTILDSTKSDKEVEQAVFNVVDKVFDVLKTDEMKNLFTNKISPYLKDNKEELGKMMEKAAKRLPGVSKLRFKGADIIDVLTDPKALESVEEIYNSVKNGSNFKAARQGFALLVSSKATRVVAFQVVSALIVDFLVSLVPNFINRAIMGKSCNELIGNLKPTAEQKIDLSEAFSTKNGYRYQNNYCRGLIFEDKKFENFKISNFNFKDCNFKGEELSFAGSELFLTDFSKAKFNCKTLDLSNCSIDIDTFNSMLPELEKLKKLGVKIETEGIKITVPSGQDIYKDLEKSEFVKEHIKKENIKVSIIDKFSIKQPEGSVSR